ncbi:MAG: ABC transporter ATP-binding protein [Anaerolineae bacterium]
MAQTPIIRIEQLHKTYHTGSEIVQAVHDVSLNIYAGQLTAIVGRSGAGKTTLLNCISGLDTPSEGRVILDGQDLFQLNDDERIQLRRDKIGLIFQNFGLLPLLSAQENVGVPLRMQGIRTDERNARVIEALDWVGLGKRKHHRPYELSGGEQQRVAIARALASRPSILLADEPTGQLDSQTGKRIIDTMRDLTAQLQITLVIVTHDPLVMSSADITHEMLDGRVIETRMPDPVGTAMT